MNKIILPAVAMALATTPVQAQDASGSSSQSNFTYSSLGIQLGKVTPEQELVFLGEVYEEFGAAAITGTVQLANNFAIGGSSAAYANSGNRTEITNSSLSLNLFFPIPIADRVDLVPRVGFVRVETEFCADGICASEDDSVVAYGLASRIWVAPDKLEVNVGFSDVNEEDSESTIALGGAIWATENHRFALDYETSDSVDAVFVGYSYNW
ncbi:hypothetical protein [Marinobacter sp. CHS3-4]|uniref:hypothetical protein n=1 Tax=Marinobacter sp. CHS3-4 TaxID=3045174 RepID=UPI0024B4EFCB|nr:hypothetical protein [Marinobacter sp. CHS3-4]MDI9244667.1 hypothetical protein [Marinobacter sp. CHS3-4]